MILSGADSTGSPLLFPVGIFLHQYLSPGAEDFWTFGDRFAKLSRHVLGKKAGPTANTRPANR
jgi:hypothetical protein